MLALPATSLEPLATVWLIGWLGGLHGAERRGVLNMEAVERKGTEGGRGGKGKRGGE